MPPGMSSQSCLRPRPPPAASAPVDTKGRVWQSKERRANGRPVICLGLMKTMCCTGSKSLGVGVGLDVDVGGWGGGGGRAGGGGLKHGHTHHDTPTVCCRLRGPGRSH